MHNSFIFQQYICYSGFGGLGVACWPLVPKFAGSNPAEAVGFLRAKKKILNTPSEGRRVEDARDTIYIPRMVPEVKH